MDPKNRNEEACNLPDEEITALKQLVKLQKRIIPCYKGIFIYI